MSLDLYAKYFWTHQEGFSATVAEDRFTFKDSDSQRLRGGTRFAWTPDKRISPYVGAAYEYEFDGRARASTYDRGIDAPRLKGGTGMAELGLSLRPVENGPVSFDLGVQGYTGKREGVTGSLQFKLEF